MKDEYGPSLLAEVYKTWCGFSAQLKEIFTIQAYPACPISKMIDLDKQAENINYDDETQYSKGPNGEIFCVDPEYQRLMGEGIKEYLYGYKTKNNKKEEQCQNQVEKQ